MTFGKHKAFTIAGILILSITLTYGIFRFVQYAAYENTTTGTLSEIENGVYVQTYSVYSNVPSNNTDVAIVCIDNQIRKIKGQIDICISDQEPSYSYTQTNRVSGDKLTVFVPRGTVQQMNSVAAK